MKIALFTIILLVTACGRPQTTPKHKKYDPDLLGAWQGEAFDKNNDLKQWLHIKYANGNYTTTFKNYDNNSKIPINDEVVYGKWWVENNILYQYESHWMTSPLAYQYQIFSDCITYSLIENIDETDVNNGYTFTSCKHEN